MRNILFLILLISCGAVAQQSYLRAPRDNANQVFAGGLGEPYLFEPTVDVTAYTVSERSALPLSGNNAQRQYRHFYAYNPGSTRTVYICVGDSTGCSRDWFKLRPGMGFVDDFTYFGVGNNMTHIYYKLDSTGSQAIDVRIW